MIRLVQLMIAGIITELFLRYRLGDDTALLDGWFEVFWRNVTSLKHWEPLAQ